MTFEAVKGEVKALKLRLEFGAARERCQGTLRDLQQLPAKDRVWLVQQAALCTYKDEELLPQRRFAQAFELLESIGLREPDATDPARVPPETLPETLALGGAVSKRVFECNGRIEDLYAALAFYRSAWERAPELDLGYGGVNAAYVLDLLASRVRTVAARTGRALDEVARLETEARTLRQRMAEVIPRAAIARPSLGDEFWYVVTLAEIHFGLRDYAHAGRLLSRARAMSVDAWQQQTTFRQLVSLARLQGHVPPAEGSPRGSWTEPWRALAEFLGDDAECAFSCWRGRVGLALSGGGFRASLFHLGVLARLAEMDVLRSVEVLSTVSGGSIVGAHYYLEVRRHLQATQDRAITREDYVTIVRRVQERFLKGVQCNLRTRTLASLPSNLKMLAPRLFGASTYTRSHRIGELYERHLYAGVEDGHPRDTRRTMPDLLVQPAGEPQDPPFKPEFSNWKRRARVPVLLLNTTALNSGHAWQFTGTWMGEPPGLVGEGVDINPRYRRLYYWQAPEAEQKRYPLGYAVAASACVPGLFEPLAIRGLYADRTVRLVDGGVHDNQGVQGLLDESCDFILCSDASGQIEDTPSPADSLLGVALRSSSVLQSRVREAEHQDLVGRLDSCALKGLFFIHLKKELAAAPLPWIGCQDAPAEAAQQGTTSYGVDRDIQRKLAALRTDLDTFSEVEAHALMLSGYAMTGQEFKALDARHRRERLPGSWGGFDIEAPRGSWPFLELEPIAAEPAGSTDPRRKDLGFQLDVGASLAFKTWKLSAALRVVSLLLLCGLVLAVAWAIRENWNETITLGPWSVAAAVTGVAIAALGLLWPALKWIDPRKATRNWITKLGIALVGWIAANIHLLVFDPIFRRRGSLQRLLKLPRH